ncbi:MAG TPA: single-stranded DNA-binding protein [Anaerolineaceae bacterium]|nr:single-stranded DNA-binding protein [Anaerolineaceae bacterium]
MAQGNHTWQRGDITSDIYFDTLYPQGREPIPYLRLYLMIDGTPEAKPVKGLRVLVYGALAELVYGHVQKGSRIGVEGHIQLRYRPNTTTPVFEVVAEKVEFLRNIDYERGKRVVEELKQRSKSRITAGPEREVINRILQSAEFAWDNEAADGG